MPFILATPVVEIQIVSENPSATRVFHMVVEKPFSAQQDLHEVVKPPGRPVTARPKIHFTLATPMLEIQITSFFCTVIDRSTKG